MTNKVQSNFNQKPFLKVRRTRKERKSESPYYYITVDSLFLQATERNKTGNKMSFPLSPQPFRLEKYTDYPKADENVLRTKYPDRKVVVHYFKPYPKTRVNL